MSKEYPKGRGREGGGKARVLYGQYYMLQYYMLQYYTVYAIVQMIQSWYDQ